MVRGRGRYLYLTAGQTFLTVRGGVNHYPLRVESVLIAQPAAGDVVVLGVPRHHLGERSRRDGLRDTNAAGEAPTRELLPMRREPLGNPAPENLRPASASKRARRQAREVRAAREYRQRHA